MSDPVFDAILRRQLADARAAIVELLARCEDLDEDPLDDPTGYVTAPAARDAVTVALAERDHTRGADPDRATVTVEDLRDQLLTDGVRLEREAVHMAGGPDFQNAHQGRALGLQQAGLRLTDLLLRTTAGKAS
jgi:hypothetical protein